MSSGASLMDIGISRDISPPTLKKTPRENHGYKTLTVNGTSLAYREAGPSDGEPIILMHGHLSDLRTYIPVQDQLASNGYHVYVYSRRYAWPNTPIGPDEQDDWVAHSKDMAAFIEGLNLGKKVSLVGNSSGGFISLLCTHARPDLVATLTIEESPVVPIFFPGGIPPSLWGILRFLLFYPFAFVPVMWYFIFILNRVASVLGEGDEEGGIAVFMHGLLGSVYYGELSKERHVWTADNSDYTAAFVTRPPGLPRFTEEDAISVGAKVPTLCIIGEDTGDYGSREATRRLGKIMPGAKTVWINGASHIVHENRPKQVVQAVMDHMERNVKKTN